MKKFNIGKLLSILVIIFTLIGIMPTVCKAEDNDLISMKVSYGVDGSFKGSTSIPVNIEIENNGEEIDGQVEVRVPSNMMNTYDAFVTEVKLNSKEKRTVTIPVNMPRNTSKISVVFTKEGKIIKQNSVTISSGRINENDLLMGTLTDDLNGLTIRDLDFSDINKNSKRNHINKVSSAPLDLEFLSKSPKNISQFDVIVINNYNVSNLQKDQYENLSTWINNGGTLIIGSGENSSKTIANISKEFSSVTYNGTKDISGYTLANLSVKDSQIKLQEGENPLIYLINQGKGRIYISTFDLANKNIASKENVINAWKESLGQDFVNKNNNNNMYRNGRYAPDELDNLSNTVPSKEEFKMGRLVAIFAVYALIIGVIIYLIMKKLNKRELLWGIIPIIAITFSLILYFLGSSTRIQDIVLNQVNIISTDENGTSTASGYVGIGSKYKDNLVIKQPEGATIQAYSNHDRNYNDKDLDINKLSKLQTKTVFRENSSYYEFKDLSALSMKKFEVSGHKEIVPKIEAKLNFNSQKLMGKIKNTLGYNIEKLLVVSSNSVWNLGEVEANEEKQIDVNNYFASGLQEYGYSLEDDFYSNYKSKNSPKENKDKYKDILRITPLISGMGELQLLNKGTYLVAITDMPVDYGFDFGKKSVSKYDTTAIIQDLDIDFADTEGNLCYPLGYFKGEISKSDPNIDIDSSNNEINGSGEIVLDYSIDKITDLLDLKVGYIENQNRKPASFKGTAYIYNYEKNDYDQINYVANGESLKNPKQYIKNGKITIKLKINDNDEDSIGMPQISVKGRAK